MRPDQCIYYATEGACRCKALAHVRPNCPWCGRDSGGYVCQCQGLVGQYGFLRANRPPVVLQPAPTLMRWMAR